MIKELEAGTPVKLRGTLKAIKHNNDKSAIVLWFSSPPNTEEIRGVIHQNGFKDTYDIMLLDKYIEKKITLDGKLVKNPNGAMLVDIKNYSDITTLAE